MFGEERKGERANGWERKRKKGRKKREREREGSIVLNRFCLHADANLSSTPGLAWHGHQRKLPDHTTRFYSPYDYPMTFLTQRVAHHTMSGRLHMLNNEGWERRTGGS